MTDYGKAEDFVTRSTDPYTGGPALEHLVEPVTPNQHFFIRNHAPEPVLDRATYRLSLTNLDGSTVQIGFAELDQLPRHTVRATLQCAGNRRSDLYVVKDVPGEVPWGSEAVSTADWSGWRLADVLSSAGMSVEQVEHVEFVGADRVSKPEGAVAFGASIPIAKALACEVILADTMNGEPLALVHGSPLRAVVPGYVGARSVKWLEEVNLLQTRSTNFYQSGYSLHPPHATREQYDPAEAVELAELTVNSVICLPHESETLPSGPTTVSGWATAGGDRTVARVEVSADGGDTWQPANLLGNPEPYVWTLWTIELNLEPGNPELVVRATDSEGNAQPDDPTPLWNFKGYMNNAWHRSHVTVGAEARV